MHLGLGSNAGESKEILENAVSALSKILIDIKCSSLYKTKPQGFVEQKDFLNCVICGYYSYSAIDLLKEIQNIEKSYGRIRDKEIAQGPRTLDIDIELFGNEVINLPNLHIPHQRMKERQFVLIPLLEISPKSIDPVTGIQFSLIAQSLPDQGVVLEGPIYGN